jgi:hypothetical protein
MTLIREDCGVATLEIPRTGWRQIVIPVDAAGVVIGISTYTPFGAFYSKGVVISTPAMTVAYDSASGGILCSLTEANVTLLTPESGTFSIGYTDGSSIKHRVLRGNFLKV